VGKFAADLELCCRELPSSYPVNIPVYIRGHPPISQQIGGHSRKSITPSLAGGIAEEQPVSLLKRPSRGRIPSFSHSGYFQGIDNDNNPEASKSSSLSYKTFHIVRDSDFFRPKLLADPTTNENESIDQINTLYMRGI
jgi:hypothetical protein